MDELKAAGVEDVTIVDVSGSYELPMACSRCARDEIWPGSVRQSDRRLASAGRGC